MRRLVGLWVALFCVILTTAANAAQETIVVDAEKGHWFYENKDAKIVVTRKRDDSIPLIWYEAELFLSEESPLIAVLRNEKTKKNGFFDPEVLARSNQLVFAINDDYYGHRIYNKEVPGIIVRNGKVVETETMRNGNRGFPNLDTMAIFADGSLKVFESREHSSGDYMQMGAEHVFAFGPILIREGQLNPRLTEEQYSAYEPRVGFGMIEPFHYICVVTEGRNETSKGMTCQGLAELLLRLGAVEALNLDGGQTAALVFMGEKINMTGIFNNRSRIRSISSMLGCCISEAVPE